MILLYVILAPIFALEFIYFIVGLFYPFWFLSIIFIMYIIADVIFISKKGSIEEIIKRSKLKGFETTNIRFERLLKLNELGGNIKVREWTLYIPPIIRTLVFVLLIVVHFNFSEKIIREGYYTEIVNLMSEDQNKKGEKGTPYNVHVFVSELQKYNNGLSKIQLVKSEVVSGFDTSKYDWVLTSIRSNFSSIRKTSDIEWLYKK